jgi:hypothetical protein
MAFWQAPFTLVTWPAGLPTRRCLPQPSWPMSHMCALALPSVLNGPHNESIGFPVPDQPMLPVPAAPLSRGFVGVERPPLPVFVATLVADELFGVHAAGGDEDDVGYAPVAGGSLCCLPVWAVYGPSQTRPMAAELRL